MTRTTYSTSMNKKVILMRGVKTKDDIYSLFKIVDKLEQRIATLEKVLASHAKCIGEIRTWETTDTSGDKTIWVGKR